MTRVYVFPPSGIRIYNHRCRYYLQKESIHDVPQTSNIYDIVDFTHHSLHYIIVYQQSDYNFDIIPYLSVVVLKQ